MKPIRPNIVIQHAAFAPERKSTLERLVSQLIPQVPLIVSSQKPEKSHVWAERAWKMAEDQPTVFLNDDVEVCGLFAAICDAILKALPKQEIISLATTGHSMVGPFLTRWHVTGPGYILRNPKKVLDWLATVPKWFVEANNEDVVLTYYAWEQLRQPIYSTMPALVQHDCTVPSLMGHDKQSLSGRTSYSFQKEIVSEATEPAFWTPTKIDPIHYPNPWLPASFLMDWEIVIQRWRSLRNLQGFCIFCLNEPTMFKSDKTSAELCEKCANKLRNA